MGNHNNIHRTCNRWLPCHSAYCTWFFDHNSLFRWTFPLKRFGLGEVAVFITSGPLMVGGAYFIVTGVFSWFVVLASLPYALGTTLVILEST